MNSALRPVIGMRHLLRRRAALALALALGLAGASFAKTEFDGVTVVVADAVHGAAERRVDDPEQVATIVEEVNAVRRKSWSSWQGKLANCAVRLSFHGADGRVGALVLQGDELIELGASRTAGTRRELGNFEAPVTRRLAARIRKPSDCK